MRLSKVPVFRMIVKIMIPTDSTMRGKIMKRVFSSKIRIKIHIYLMFFKTLRTFENFTAIRGSLIGMQMKMETGFHILI